jgi:hypothetical protein
LLTLSGTPPLVKSPPAQRSGSLREAVRDRDVELECGRYIIWRNRHAGDTRLRRVVARASTA